MFRRSLHVLRTSLTILSIVFFLATIGLWVRGRFANDRFNHWTEFNRPGFHEWRDVFLSFGKNGSYLSYRWRRDTTSFASPSQRQPGFTHERLPPQYGKFGHIDGPAFQFDFAGIVWDHQFFDQPDSKFSGYTLILPHWFFAVLFAILPALKLRAILRARKQTRGFEVSLATDEPVGRRPFET